MEIVLGNMSEYPQVLRRLFQWGEPRSPRGLKTLDTGFTTIMLHNPVGGMPLGIGRSLNRSIGAVEAVQLIAGVSDPQLVLRLAPQFERYLDSAEDGSGQRRFWGAYGERIKMQASCAVAKLRADGDSRQAVITLWDPWLDNAVGKHDYPCTIAIHVFMYNGTLNMNVIMRSNDAWLGLPYDVFQFTQLQASMARSLEVESGTYRHTTLSLHLYESNFEAAHALIDGWSPRHARESYAKIWQPDGIGDLGDDFTTIQRRAEALIVNAPIDNETESEAWYREQLHPTSS